MYRDLAFMTRYITDPKSQLLDLLKDWIKEALPEILVHESKCV